MQRGFAWRLGLVLLTACIGPATLPSPAPSPSPEPAPTATAQATQTATPAARLTLTVVYPTATSEFEMGQLVRFVIQAADPGGQPSPTIRK